MVHVLHGKDPDMGRKFLVVKLMHNLVVFKLEVTTECFRVVPGSKLTEVMYAVVYLLSYTGT